MGSLSIRQSFPRRREPTRQGCGDTLLTDWIPAFAGMTASCNSPVSQMTQEPRWDVSRETCPLGEPRFRGRERSACSVGWEDLKNLGSGLGAEMVGSRSRVARALECGRGACGAAAFSFALKAQAKAAAPQAPLPHSKGFAPSFAAQGPHPLLKTSCGLAAARPKGNCTPKMWDMLICEGEGRSTALSYIIRQSRTWRDLEATLYGCFT
jgi:hypothetical protein